MQTLPPSTICTSLLVPSIPRSAHNYSPRPHSRRRYKFRRVMREGLRRELFLDGRKSASLEKRPSRQPFFFLVSCSSSFLRLLARRNSWVMLLGRLNTVTATLLKMMRTFPENIGQTDVVVAAWETTGMTDGLHPLGAGPPTSHVIGSCSGVRSSSCHTAGVVRPQTKKF